MSRTILGFSEYAAVLARDGQRSGHRWRTTRRWKVLGRRETARQLSERRVCVLGCSRRKFAPAGLAIAYAVAEGLFVGGISAFFEMIRSGIVIQAALASIAVIGTTLALFANGKIRSSERALFRRATGVCRKRICREQICPERIRACTPTAARRLKA